MTTSFLDTVQRVVRTLLPNMTPAVEEAEKQHHLFEQLSFAVIRSATLDEKEAAKIVERLKIHGAEAVVDQYPSENLELEGVTHIITSTADFPDYHLASDRFIPIVRPQWIEDSIAKQRHLQPRQYSANPRYFMSDVVVCCADIPEGDADAIAGGILAMGGNFTTKITSLVTHIVALSLENDMCETASLRKLNCKIVLPHWFDDCLKLGRKIDEKPYELPSPDILQDLNTKAPNGKLKNEHVSGAINPHPPENPGESIHGPITIFKDKTFMLSNDLGIGMYLRGILHGMIDGSGGNITEDVSEADYFVCKYREGKEYKQASKAGIDVGNLAWLYYLIMHNEWTSPFRRLLHYPIARHGLPGFRVLKISLSNYTGEARTYMENLIAATGAECTKTLRQENTHLITAHDQSEKCAAARDWNVHMINHLWLEESYAKWQMQSITIPRYTHFPRRTNLGEVVGQTQINREVITERFLTDDDTEMVDAPTNDQLSKSKQISPETNGPGSSPPPPRTSRAQKTQEEATRAEQERYHTPVPSRHIALGKENVTPMTTGSRKSKDVATAKLHSMTPDIALYEKEKKRAGGVVYGGRRKAAEKDTKTSRKRSVDALDSDEDAVENKKQRKGQEPISMHLLISGYKRWIGKPKEEDAEIKRLRELGIVVVSEPSKATHIAVPHIVRTPKFVIALAYAPMILDTSFVDECLAQDVFLDPNDFKLKDTVNEKKLGTSLKLSCERAKENQHQLLAGRNIYVVEKIEGGFETFKAIVEANGGQCMTYRGRHTSAIPSRRAGSGDSADEDPSHEVILLCSDAKEDSKVWSRFIKMAEGSRKAARILNTNWLLETAMCQKIQPTAPYEMRLDK